MRYRRLGIAVGTVLTVVAIGAPASLRAQDAKKGEELFKSKTCVMCHTIGGLAGAAGAFGPDVTHLGSRTTLAGAWLFNYDDKKYAEAEAAAVAKGELATPVVDKAKLKANIIQWIASSGMTTGPDGKPSKDVKPGNRMHNYKGMFGVTGLLHGAPGDKPVPLSHEEIDALAEYLAGLE